MSERKTLLGYVPDLLEDLERRQAAVQAAQAEAKQISEKIAQTEIALYARRAELVKPDRSRALAAAALAGATPPPEPQDPPGPRVEDLEDTIRGLKAMKADADKRAKDLQGEVGAAVLRLFPAAAERAAADYVKLGKALAEVHAAIGAAEQGARSAPGRPPWEGVIGGEDWHKLYVPITEQLEAFIPYIEPMRSVQVIAGGGPSESFKATGDAFAEAKAEIRRRLGGRWPFDRE